MRYGVVLIGIMCGVDGCASAGMSPPAPNGSSAVVQRPLETPDPVPRKPTAEWLQGTWLHDATAEDVFRIACNSDTTTTYPADGTTANWGDSGRWTLADGKLTETVVEVFDNTDPTDVPAVGKPYTVQIRRVGPHEGAVLTDTGWQSMLRCRPGDIAK